MSPLHWIIGIMSNAAFSILLMGLIIGFGVGTWNRSSSPALANAPPAPVIQAPSPQAPLRPPGGGCGLQ